MTDTATDAPPLRLAGWAQRSGTSALQTMLSVGTRPGTISLALGLPAPELFPVEEYGRAQQGLSLLARLLLEPGAEVIAETLCYTGFQQAVEPFQPRILTVPTSPETGMDVDAVEALLAGGARPAFIYTVPDGSNPLAVSMPQENRVRLAELARRYGVPVVEDDPYGLLAYDGPPAHPIRALEREWVFYVGSFSKVLAPALRLGWLVVPERLVPLLAISKEASDINTATFSQRAASRYLEGGHLPGHLSMLRREYRRRRDAMIAALENHFPAGSRWRRPAAGVFVWVELPEGFDAGEVLRVALEQRVAFVPGHAFAADGSRAGSNCMRLNFSHSTPEMIEEAVARLGRALQTAAP
jgi:2-aminoadipate transaminase